MEAGRGAQDGHLDFHTALSSDLDHELQAYSVLVIFQPYRDMPRRLNIVLYGWEQGNSISSQIRVTLKIPSAFGNQTLVGEASMAAFAKNYTPPPPRY